MLIFNRYSRVLIGVAVQNVQHHVIKRGDGQCVLEVRTRKNSAFSLDNSTAGSQHLLFSPTTLHPGDTYTVDITGTSTKKDASPITLTGTLTNTATVTVGNEQTPDNPGDHTATDTITVANVPTPTPKILRNRDEAPMRRIAPPIMMRMGRMLR